MNDTITFYEKFNYGQSDYYIASEHAEAIRTLTRRKTVNIHDINALKALGFNVQQVIAPEAIAFMTDRLVTA